MYEIHPLVYCTASKCSVYIQPGDHLFIVLLVLRCPGNSCFAAPVILLRFEELSSGSRWECAYPPFIAKQNTHCSWDLNLFTPLSFFSHFSVLLCTNPLSPPSLFFSFFHLSLFLSPLHLILDRGNYQSGVEDFKQELKSAHINTHTRPHIRLCWYWA